MKVIIRIVILLPKNKKYLLIVDLEATCANDGSIPRKKTEIIEIGAVLVDQNLNIIKEYSEFIKPVIYPILHPFCTELTTITQKQVDNALDFYTVFNDFISKMYSDDTLFCSWGYYDDNQIKRECIRNGVDYPFDMHLNVKVRLAEILQLKKPKSIASMLRYFNLEFVGTAHRGIDDVKNIVRIMKSMQHLLY